MNDTKRKRREFRPGVDSLEGRLVMSSGGAVHAAQVAHAEHLHQLKEQRHLLQEQRVEHRKERQHLLKEERAARQHARFVLAPQANPGTATSNLGTTAPQSSLPRSSSSQATATGVTVSSTKVPLTRIPQPAVVGAARFGALTASVVQAQRSASTRTARSGLNPNLANVVNANLLASGNSRLNPAVLNNSTPTAALSSNQSNIFGTGTSTATGSNTGTLFTNVPTAAGTSFVNTTGPSNPGVVFNNLSTAPGTFTSTGTTGLNTGTTGTLFNNLSTAPGTFSTGVNASTSVLNTAGVNNSGVSSSVLNPSGAVVSSTPTNAMVSAPLQTSIGAVTTAAALGLNTNPLIISPGGSTII